MRCLALALISVSLPAQPQGLSPMQVMRLQHVTGAYPAPDGSRVAFTRARPQLAEAAPGSSSLNELWLVGADGNGERQLVAGKSVRGVAWTHDGSALSYLVGGDLMLLPMTGGEPQRIDVGRAVSAYEWSPDGDSVAFTSLDDRDAGAARASELGFAAHVVDEDFRHLSLWSWQRSSGDRRRLTEGVTVFSFRWAPTGGHLAAAIAPRNLVDDSYMHQRLHRVDVDGRIARLCDNVGKLGSYAWSPDGTKLAFLGAEDRNDPHAGMLFVVDGDGVRELSRGFLGMCHQVEWQDDDTLVVSVSEGVHTRLWTWDLDGTRGELWGGGTAACRDFAVGGGGRFWLVGSTPAHPDELIRLDRGRIERITDSNPWLSDVALGDNRVLTFTARDGTVIEGILMFPLGYQQGRRHPLVIVAHGGPESHYSFGWNTGYSAWGQVLCARGYFAWYPNYRASTGYGVAFAKADHGDPMGREFEDHLDAIAHLDELGYIDLARVGIGGGSYGGYTAAWAATAQSEHFAAAVSFVPFVDIRTKWYTSDIPDEFYLVHYQEKWPHEQQEFLASRSPLTWVSNCRTPLLVLGGTADPRVHPSQPFMLYRAVKTATDTPVRYVQYPGEGHGNRSSVNRYDYMLRTLRWFDHYLQGSGDRRRAPPPPWAIDLSQWTAADAGR